MSVARRLVPALLAMAGSGAGGMLTPAIAADFDQQEVDPNRIIAIAAPVNNSLHQLLILEQLSDVRPCWSEDSNGSTRVEPLLVNFDFTDICGRSNDSNGYSLRIGGQDLGIDFRLRVVRRGQDLVLEAASVRNPNREVIEIGRAPASMDFTRIELNPGWRMTKRVYNGEVLQHIYLTNDQPLAQVLAQSRSTAGRERGSSLTTRLDDSRSSLSASRAPSSTFRPTVPSDNPPTFDRRPDYNSRPASSAQPDYNSNYETRPISGGIPLRPPTGVRSSGSGSRPNNDSLPSVAVRPTPGTPSRTGGSVDWDTPPSRPNTNSNVAYRVIVNSTSATVQDQVRSIVPDAFRANVNGQTVMQAGLFRDRTEANAVHQQLLAANLPSRILTITGDIPTAQAPSVNAPDDLPAAPRGRTVVVIDPGHGGRDPGAVGVGGLQEVQVVNAVAQRVVSLLQQQGVQVVMTRRDNRTLELSDRVAIANRANAAAFISIHANAAAASSANGTETFYASSRGVPLARSIQNNLIQATGMNNRGVKQARFYVIRNTSMPSALVELGFVTNSSDARRLRDPAFRNRMADAIARGILQYLRSR